MKRLFALNLVGLIMLAACSAGGTSGNASGELTVVSDGFQYDPDEITLTAGEPVTLTFKNRSVIDHEFNLDTLPIAEGQVIALSGEAGRDDHHGDDHEHFGEHHECEEHAHEESDGHEHSECSIHDHDDGGAHFHAEHTEEIPTVHLHAEAGDEVSLIFTPTEPGTYEVYCAIEDHYSKGHHGTLIVEAP